MANPIPPDIALLLESEAARINNPDFIKDDPVQFPRRFDRLQDIEISTLLCSSIAWGKRTMICRDCDRMLALMGHDPYHYVMEKAYEDLPDINIHRTFFTRNLRHFLRGLNLIYSRYDTLQEFARQSGAASCEAPAWMLADKINAALSEANGGTGDSRCLPLNTATSALKRLNMGLRWLVRDDGIVDLGVWDVITPAALRIPLDVHVGNTARELGLTSRKANDRRTAEEITDAMRTLRPSDPAFFDYALFGIGVARASRTDG